MSQLLSPKQVAKSLGVSESSLKRWCDQGLIRTEKTPGGHRRILIGDVVQFLRETKRPLKQAELLGLPLGSGKRADSREDIRDGFEQAMLRGEEAKCRRIVVDRYLGGSSVVDICEGLIAPAMHRFGDLWQCGSTEIYNERLACEIVGVLLSDLRGLLPQPTPNAPFAIGGTTSGDNYRLATAMVQLVLIDNGWRAVSLGHDLPYSTLRAAVEEQRPDLLWLSISRVVEPEDLAAELRAFAETIPESTRLLVGGRSVEPIDPASLPEFQISRSLQDLSTLTTQTIGGDSPNR